MKNKTCGECKYLDGDRYCNFLDFEPKPEMGGCANFEPKPTNGDRIRHMSNEELAEFISVHTICSNCPARTDECLHNAIKVCKKKWLKWLNAPAESERENE